MPNQPVQPNQRMVIVDILRGWALLGVVLMNYFDFYTLGKNWNGFEPDGLTRLLFHLSDTFFAAKSWTLLSLLFGYGFAMQLDKAKEMGLAAHGFLLRRMFWLLLFGLFNSALFFGDILKDYALFGLVLLLFYRCSTKTLCLVGVLLLLIVPALAAYVNGLADTGWAEMLKLIPLYQSNKLNDVLYFGLKGTYLAQVISKPYLYTVHVVMLSCFLWGMVLYRCRCLHHLAHQKQYLIKAFWASLGTAVGLHLFTTLAQRLGWVVQQQYNLRYWLILSTMLCMASGICWLHVAGRFKIFLAHLAMVGRMTLTNYMLQNLIGLLVFSGFGFGVFNTQPLWFYLLLALGVYLVQVCCSTWWLSRYRYGPIEWLWRRLAYAKHLPIRKHEG